MDHSAFEHLLATTRSVRRKLDLDRPVNREDILACINVAVQAPTGRPGETWRFLVVTDVALKQQIAEVYRGVIEELTEQRGLELKPTQHALVDALPRMPCLVFVFGLGKPMPGPGGQTAFYGSILPAAWSLMLAMRGRGIGATWTTVLSARSQEIAAILDVPADVTQTVMLPCAYALGAKLKPADRLPAEDVTYWNRWGAPT